MRLFAVRSGHYAKSCGFLEWRLLPTLSMGVCTDTMCYEVHEQKLQNHTGFPQLSPRIRTAIVHNTAKFTHLSHRTSFLWNFLPLLKRMLAKVGLHNTCACQPSISNTQHPISRTSSLNMQRSVGTK